MATQRRHPQEPCDQALCLAHESYGPLAQIARDLAGAQGALRNWVAGSSRSEQVFDLGPSVAGA